MSRAAFYAKMITMSLVRRRSRMLVTLLAVAVGATILSGLMTIYYDIPRQLSQEFRSYGANLILLPSANQEDSGEGEKSEGEKSGLDPDAKIAQSGGSETGDGSLSYSSSRTSDAATPAIVEDASCSVPDCHDATNPFDPQGIAPTASWHPAVQSRPSAATATAPSIPTQAAEQALALLPAENLVGVAPYRYAVVKIHEQVFMAAGTNLDGARLASPYWHVEGEWPQDDGDNGAGDGNSDGSATGNSTANAKADGTSGDGTNANATNRIAPVLIGKEIADTAYLKVGSSFEMTGTGANGQSFTHEYLVSGVLETGGSEEAFVFLSLEDFEQTFGAGGYDIVEISVSASADELATLAERIQQEAWGVTPRLVKRVTQSENAVLSKLSALVLLVTLVVLLLTMICVATTMMAVVTERRREIGLRKALGATDGGILLEFSSECMLIGFFGGILGVALGFVFAQVVSMQVFARVIAFQPLMIPLTVVASMAVTGIASLLPVRSATEVDPALVLRGE
jgi:putative ABC transport system permease protein